MCCWAVALALFSVSTRVEARPKAASIFERGLAHYRNKEFSEAAADFYKAYQLSPHADSLYNAGLAWELAGDKANAATAYETVLQDELHPEALADARARLNRLSPDLARVEVAAPDGATIRVPPFVIEKSKAVVYFEPGRRSRARDATERSSRRSSGRSHRGTNRSRARGIAER